MNKEQLIQGLDVRKKQLIKLLNNDPIYLEYRTINKTIKTLNGSSVESKTSEVIRQPRKLKQQKISNTYDMDNSPVAFLGKGARTAYVYNCLRQVLKEYGPELSIERAKILLEEKYNIVAKGKVPNGWLTSYIINGRNQMNLSGIKMLPEPKSYGKRVYRYKSVRLV